MGKDTAVIQAKTLGSVAALSIFMAVAIGSVAWACSAQPRIYGVELLGPAGAHVTVRGEAFPHGSEGIMASGEPVRIRWNGSSGPQVASVVPNAEGTFAASVTIPDVSPGVYFLTAGTEDRTVSRTAFEVVPSATIRYARTEAGSFKSVSSDVWNGLNRTVQSGDGRPLALASSPSSSVMIAGGALFAVGLGGLGSVLILTMIRRRRGAGPGAMIRTTS